MSTTNDRLIAIEDKIFQITEVLEQIIPPQMYQQLYDELQSIDYPSVSIVEYLGSDGRI